MAFRSCTDCLNADQASSMVSVTCRDGSQVDAGLGSEAFGFMIIDQGLGDNAFCRACAERVQSRNCPTSQSGRPNVEVEPIGGSGMRSAIGGTPCRCENGELCGKLMSNGMCDCRACKSGGLRGLRMR